MQTELTDRNGEPLPDDWRPVPTLADRLVLLRRHLGRTVAEMADLCDVAHATWSTWERGVEPSRLLEVVEKIARATKVSRQWLVFGDQN